MQRCTISLLFTAIKDDSTEPSTYTDFVNGVPPFELLRNINRKQNMETVYSKLKLAGYKEVHSIFWQPSSCYSKGKPSFLLDL